jgi:XRE family transcriptional regulator, fatty acid utilization regulator
MIAEAPVLDAVELGRRIRLFRKRLDLSQEELAEAVGCAQAAISAWERAEYSPSSLQMPALADALGIKIDDLLRDARKPPKT